MRCIYIEEHVLGMDGSEPILYIGVVEEGRIYIYQGHAISSPTDIDGWKMRCAPYPDLTVIGIYTPSDMKVPPDIIQFQSPALDLDEGVDRVVFKGDCIYLESHPTPTSIIQRLNYAKRVRVLGKGKVDSEVAPRKPIQMDRYPLLTPSLLLSRYLSIYAWWRGQECLPYQHTLLLNTLIITSLDILFGWGIFLLTSSTILCCVGNVEEVVEKVSSSLWFDIFIWLSQESPAGIKLAYSLNAFMGNLAMTVVVLWRGVLYHLLDMGVVLTAMRYSLLLGVSTSICFVVDFLSFCCLFSTAFSWTMRKVITFHTQSLLSLWRLFQGKRWNTLRGRVDSYQYPVEFFILGSIVFTALLLTLPTTGAYYIIAMLSAWAILLIRKTVMSTLSSLHHLPAIEIISACFPIYSLPHQPAYSPHKDGLRIS